jgi:hypothetical protein
MARAGTPWAVVLTAVTSALVAVGALAMSASLRDRGAAGGETDTTTSPATATSGPGVDGCLVGPCTVLADLPVGGVRVQLVADRDATSGRLRIGGGGVSEVIEATITDVGAVLGPESLQCVAGTLSACVLRGQFPDGVVGQVVVGRTGKWNELTQPFQSDAGYLALVDVTPDTGAEILAAQHRCDRKVVADCGGTPVYVRVYNLRSQELGCTGNYRRLESLPDWPAVTLTSADLRPCA